ncbi:MAG: hypothetical protein V3U98_05170 [Acidobacteriota bacterium]
MNPHKLLLLFWIALLLAGVLGLLHGEISFTRSVESRIGPLEFHRPATTSVEIPRTVVFGILLIGTGMTIYTIFFKLK